MSATVLAPPPLPQVSLCSAGGASGAGSSKVSCLGSLLAFPCACKCFSRLRGQAGGDGGWFQEGSPPWEEGGGTMAGETGTLQCLDLPPTRETGLLGGVCGVLGVGLGDDVTAHCPSCPLFFTCLVEILLKLKGPGLLCAKRAFPDGALKHNSAWCSMSRGWSHGDYCGSGGEWMKLWPRVRVARPASPTLRCRGSVCSFDVVPGLVG